MTARKRPPADTPRPAGRPIAEPDHGTRARYVYRPAPCRCDACRDAHADYMRRFRRRRRGAS